MKTALAAAKSHETERGQLLTRISSLQHEAEAAEQQRAAALVTQRKSQASTNDAERELADARATIAELEESLNQANAECAILRERAAVKEDLKELMPKLQEFLMVKSVSEELAPLMQRLSSHLQEPSQQPYSERGTPAPAVADVSLYLPPSERPSVTPRPSDPSPQRPPVPEQLAGDPLSSHTPDPDSLNFSVH